MSNYYVIKYMINGQYCHVISSRIGNKIVGGSLEQQWMEILEEAVSRKQRIISALHGWEAYDELLTSLKQEINSCEAVTSLVDDVASCVAVAQSNLNKLSVSTRTLSMNCST